jgi:hypothetical protein
MRVADRLAALSASAIGRFLDEEVSCVCGPGSDPCLTLPCRGRGTRLDSTRRPHVLSVRGGCWCSDLRRPDRDWGRMIRAKLAFCAGALLLLGAGAQVGEAKPWASAAGLPKLLTVADGKTFKVRPATVAFTGDGTAFMAGKGSSARHPGRIHWKRWTKRSAKGVGRVWVNDCNPGCAQGHYHPHRGSITATRRRHGRFTHLGVHWRQNKRGQFAYRRLRHVAGNQYAAGYWQWAYVTH